MKIARKILGRLMSINMTMTMATTMVITRHAKLLSANCPDTYTVGKGHSVAFDVPSIERLNRGKHAVFNNPARFIS